MNEETKKLLSEIEGLSGEEKKKTETSELEMLRREKLIRENLMREMEEFSQLFPDTDIDSVPDEVWDTCPDGAGICAAYALFLKRQEMKKMNADKKNEENTSSAIPNVKNDDGEIFFTPEAVEKMSRKDVEKNWNSILSSMKHWK